MCVLGSVKDPLMLGGEIIVGLWRVSLWEFLRELQVAMNSLAFGGEDSQRSLPLCPLALRWMKETSPGPRRLGRAQGGGPIRGQAFLCPDSTWVTLGREIAGSFLGPQCSIYKLQLVANKICASTTNCQLKRLKVQS